MGHIILETHDIPVAPPLVDRRQQPDRRATWRGGRRDSDWISRPPGALARFAEREPRPSRWLRALSTLHIW